MRLIVPEESSIVYKLDLPSVRELNRIFCPSGENCGVEVVGPFMNVNWMGRDPSAFDNQISSVPERVEANAIRCPSGEYAGV